MFPGLVHLKFIKGNQENIHQSCCGRKTIRRRKPILRGVRGGQEISRDSNPRPSAELSDWPVAEIIQLPKTACSMLAKRLKWPHTREVRKNPSGQIVPTIGNSLIQTVANSSTIWRAVLGTPSYGLGTVGNRLGNAKLWVGNRWESAWERQAMGWEPLGIGLGTQTYGLGTVGHIWEPAWERKSMGGNRHPVSGLKF